MSNGTRATQVLTRAGLVFKLHAYAYEYRSESIGLQAAEALGIIPQRLLKTLMTIVDGRSVCAILPSSHEMSMKRLAAAVGGKSAELMSADQAERVTGYVVGGISPFGQRRSSPVVIEQITLTHDTVFINAGQRGLQLEMSPISAAKLLKALIKPLVA